MEPPQPRFHAYRPLRGTSQIRIVIIQPALEQQAPIIFNFHTARLDDLEGQYIAVSYVWGEPKLVFPVHHKTDGSQILVTANLDYALRRLRGSLGPQWVWADALCIDQRNDEEKAMQIPLMVDIFKRAKKVVAWLHQDDELIQQGMLCVERLSRRSLGHRARASGLQCNQCQSMGSSALTLSNANITGLRKIDESKNVESLVALFGLPYFRRLWIVQEIVSSLDIVLVCGRVEISWLQMITALTHVEDPAFSVALQRSGNSTVPLRMTASLWRSNCIDPNSTPTHIIDLVSKYSTYGCTDARDRIFAVHSLSQGKNAHTRIDYALDISTTFRDFARACIVDGKELDTLKAASARADLHCSQLPSWAPDWRARPPVEDSFTYDDNNLMVKGTPMVSYVRNSAFDEALVKLAFTPFRRDRRYDLERHAEYPLKVSEKLQISLKQQPLREFIRAIVKLFTTSEPSMLDEIDQCSLLRLFWGNGPSSLNARHFVALLKCLEGSRSTSYFECIQHIAEYEALLTEPIAAAYKGRCFFKAGFKDGDNTELCYGTTHVQSGDILMPFEEVLHSYGPNCSVYRMCVLRPAKPNFELDIPGCLGSESAWTRTPYRIIGDAWLIYPSEDASETRVTGLPECRLKLC